MFIGRDNGGGTDLNLMTGQALRHLDRNLTLLGHMVPGMELLSALPRVTGPMGFYEMDLQGGRGSQ